MLLRPSGRRKVHQSLRIGRRVATMSLALAPNGAAVEAALRQGGRLGGDGLRIGDPEAPAPLQGRKPGVRLRRELLVRSFTAPEVSKSAGR